MLHLAIVNATLASDNGTIRADIGVADGRIALLADSGSLPEVKHTIDASGLLVIPGVVDPFLDEFQSICVAPPSEIRALFNALQASDATICPAI